MNRFALFFLLLPLLPGCRSFPELEKSAAPQPLPFVLLVPHRDHRNPLEAVFLHSDTVGETIRQEFTLVFADEDQPFFLFDWIYDGFRKKHYARKKDTETFYFYSHRGAAAPDSVGFPGTYSGGQGFRKGLVEHHSRCFAAAGLTLEKNRPLIYVNTWNHLFSPADENAGMKKDTLRTAPMLTGSRWQAEGLLRRK